MVFVDGRFLQSAGWEGELNENTFLIDYEAKKVYISIDPNDKMIEITAYDSALTRTIQDCHGKKSDGKGPTIRGIVFTQYAYRAMEIEGKEPEGLSPESEHGKDVVGTTLEHCSITYCSRVAGYLRGDNMTIRHCLVSDTSTEGIYVIASNDVLLEKNIFRRNNIENIAGYFPAAVKIFNQSYRVTCNDNLVIEHPNSNGIWYDVGNVDGVFINNWVEEIGQTGRRFSKERFWPSENGFFLEISKGVICAGNVFVNCDQGILILNSSDAKIYNNTLVNSTACIGRTNRSAQGDHFGWHPSAGPDVNERDGHIFANNLLTGDENYDRPLLAFWQMSFLCDRLDKPMVNQLDYNVYVRRAKTNEPLITWSPIKADNCQVPLASPAELNKLHPEFEENSRSFEHYSGPLFQSCELRNYQVLEGFTAAENAAELPPEISKLLGTEQRFVGAYPQDK
jgi:parallel beta-helix repeat protein